MSNLSMEPGQSRITGDWRLDDPIGGELVKFDN